MEISYWNLEGNNYFFQNIIPIPRLCMRVAQSILISDIEYCKWIFP